MGGPISEVTMAKAPKDPGKPARSRQKEQKLDKAETPADDTLSEEELKKVSGGPIYMHGTGGGAG